MYVFFLTGAHGFPALTSLSPPKRTEPLCQGTSGAQICIPFLRFLCQTLEVVTRLGQLGPGPSSFWSHEHPLQGEWGIDPRWMGELFTWAASRLTHPTQSYPILGCQALPSEPHIPPWVVLCGGRLVRSIFTPLLCNCLPLSLRGVPASLAILEILDSTILRNPKLGLSATASSLFLSSPSLPREESLSS